MERFSFHEIGHVLLQVFGGGDAFTLREGQKSLFDVRCEVQCDGGRKKVILLSGGEAPLLLALTPRSP